ncbi:MAG: hypothetical protein ACE5NM_08130 [Sedimentisphaerales bacterium]
MSTKKKCIGALVAITLVGLVLVGYGCKESGTAEAAEVELCLECGQIKGSELCCQPGQTTCATCGLVKGSPGCCNIPAGAQRAAICTKCGQIKGSELCCKPNQSTCDKCGLVKGSPGCCKIPAKQG